MDQYRPYKPDAEPIRSWLDQFNIRYTLLALDPGEKMRDANRPLGPMAGRYCHDSLMMQLTLK